jgi:aspartate--ammonia ligase
MIVKPTTYYKSDGFNNGLQLHAAIDLVKEFFQNELARALNLCKVQSPLFLTKGEGVNDDLNGVEEPVSFKTRALPESEIEVIMSLAKWKRLILSAYKVLPGHGIYTIMHAIRQSEFPLDNLHSIYVDQWDWEMVINSGDRNLNYLKKIVTKIYDVFLRLELLVHKNYAFIKPWLPPEIKFIHAEEALDRYPQLSAQDREKALAEEYGAIFIVGIGNTLKNGLPHDNRAPDYDDWTAATSSRFKGLNGDIILWNPVLKNSIEISSMGIRVDKTALLKQLDITNTAYRKALYFHQSLLNDKLPLTIGGGIGQSRVCMQFLQRVHIGEVQVSVWSSEDVEQCKTCGIKLL